MPELEGRVAEEDAPPTNGPSYIISSLSMDKDKIEPCSDSVLWWPSRHIRARAENKSEMDEFKSPSRSLNSLYSDMRVSGRQKLVWRLRRPRDGITPRVSAEANMSPSPSEAME